MNEGPGNKEALLYRDLKPRTSLSAAFKMITTIIKKRYMNLVTVLQSSRNV